MKKYQDILSLKPSQFAVGMKEVEAKIEEYRALSPRKFKKLIRDTPVPVVLSPQNEMYVTDHHHFLFVCWHLQVKKVRVKVLKDLSRSKMSYRGFWKWMRKFRYFYPFCQFGEGPRHALYLPDDIRGLADDPYRSLAWFVRKEGAFENSKKTFAEFQWANFFRAKKLLDRYGKRGFELGVQKGIKLARSPKAKNLPGYIGLIKKTKA